MYKESKNIKSLNKAFLKHHIQLECPHLSVKSSRYTNGSFPFIILDQTNPT